MSRWMPVYEDDMTHWLWDNAQRYQWWLEIRFRAAKTPGMRYVGDTNIRIRVTYGEWPVTISYLKCRWHADERAINSFLQALEEDGLIKRRKSGIITVISVCGFEKYCFNMQEIECAEAQGEALDETEDSATCQTMEEMPEEKQTETGDETQLQTRPYLDIKRKDEKKKKLIVDKQAREEEFLEEFKRSQSALEGMAMSLHCETDDLISIADDFVNGIIATEDWHPTFSVFKKHFMNWARIQLKNTKNGTSEKNQSRRGYQANARRGRGPILPDCGLHED